MMTDSILFISAGLKKAKKDGNPFSTYHNYLNYGLLGLASILFREGFNAKVYHGRFFEPSWFCDNVINNSKFSPTYPLFISIPSVFALDWTREFIYRFKELIPEVKIVVGGRWVVEHDGKWIKERLPFIDLVVYDTAELRIKQLLNVKNWQTISNTDISVEHSLEPQLPAFPNYVYELMDDFMEFRPSIEVSRGCGLGCSFCIEKAIPLQRLKAPELILDEIESIQKSYQINNATPYFEASFFRPSSEWARNYFIVYNKGGFSFEWRAETRVDSLSENILELLASAGLKVLDIGLESASSIQLQRMHKSGKPEIYLERASKFLKVCKSLGIWTKINVLLYAGENRDTVAETISWLDQHRECIKGVSVNPLIVYGRNQSTIKYLEELNELGASPVGKDIRETGYSMLNISKDISFEAAEDLRVSICKEFMTSDDYFDLKSFSYFSPTLTRNLFNEICRNSNPSSLPFH